MTNYLTPPAYAKQLGVKASKVVGWINRGDLRALNVSDGDRPRWRIPMSAIAEFEERRAARPPAKPTRQRRRRRDSLVQFYK